MSPLRSFTRLLGVSALAALLSGLSIVSPSPASAATDNNAAARLLEVSNAARLANGKAPLTRDAALDAGAVAWSQKMAETYARTGVTRDPNASVFSCDPSALCHSSDLSARTNAVYPEWRGAGENVGVGGSIDGIWDALVASPPHWANQIGDYDRIGIGVYQLGTRLWVTEWFVLGPEAKPLPATQPQLSTEPVFSKLASSVAPPAISGFATLRSPIRALDTRSSSRVTTAAVAAGSFGVPSNARGAAMNVTITDPSSRGFAALYRCDEGWSGASTVNFESGQTVANLAPVALGGDRTVCFVSSVPVHVIVDIVGYWNAASKFTSNSVRLGDTRDGGPLKAGAVFRVSGFDPNRDFALNVTGVFPTAGFLSAYDCDRGPSSTSNVNATAGETRAAALLIAVPSGSLCVSTSAGGAVIVDEVASFDPKTYGALSDRLLDSRSLPRSAAQKFIVDTGSLGPVSLSVVAVDGASAGFATVWPCGQDMPTASTLNFAGGSAAVANSTVVAGGKACVYVSSVANVIVDRLGAM
jgi:uncharacterized protein YkwD